MRNLHSDLNIKGETTSCRVPADLDGGGGFLGFCGETETALDFIVIIKWNCLLGNKTKLLNSTLFLLQ